jgi:1-hydroxycarotenoid 3,4-desaturase
MQAWQAWSALCESAHEGLSVTVVDKADQVGGKMRQLMVGGAAVDSGPTVFTMRWVFGEISDLGRHTFGK